MDFGRLENLADLDRVDLSLPPEPPRNQAPFPRKSGEGEAERNNSDAPRVYIACPVWNHPGFVGTIYPSGTQPTDYLRHYARHFNSIELNTTYYGVRPELLQRWQAMVPPDFRFLPKLTKQISHDRQLRDVEAVTLEYCNAIVDLGVNLGPLFLLLPGDFGPRDLPVLREFLRRFPRGVELSVELRHPAWYQGSAFDDACGVFEEEGTIAVITDVAGRRDVLHQRLTAPQGSVFVRFVANSLHGSDYQRIDEWIDRLIDWAARGVRTIYFCLHQPDESLNVALAGYMIERLNERTRWDLRPPQPEPRQQELF